MSEKCKECKCLGWTVVDDFPIWICKVDNHMIEGNIEKASCVYNDETKKEAS